MKCPNTKKKLTLPDIALTHTTKLTFANAALPDTENLSNPAQAFLGNHTVSTSLWKRKPTARSEIVRVTNRSRL